MKSRLLRNAPLALTLSALLFVTATGQVADQGQSDLSSLTKKDQKKVNKDARKLAAKADQTANVLGRNVVFCILAAHTTDVGTAQELKDKFEASGIPFGQFVAAVLLADRIDKPLDDILAKLQQGQSLGQIARGFDDVDVSDLRKGLGDFLIELARSITNPPTRNCFRNT